MIHMTLPVIATTYLDKTNQWEGVGFQKRAEALQHIKTGKITFNPFMSLHVKAMENYFFAFLN